MRCSHWPRYHTNYEGGRTRGMFRKSCTSGSPPGFLRDILRIMTARGGASKFNISPSVCLRARVCAGGRRGRGLKIKLYIYELGIFFFRISHSLANTCPICFFFLNHSLCWAHTHTHIHGCACTHTLAHSLTHSHTRPYSYPSISPFMHAIRYIYIYIHTHTQIAIFANTRWQVMWNFLFFFLKKTEKDMWLLGDYHCGICELEWSDASWMVWSDIRVGGG